MELARRLVFKDLPEKCKQCKWLPSCLWFTINVFDNTGVYFDCPRHCPSQKDWEIRTQKCERNNWFKWEEKLTKYDFEPGEILDK